MKRNNVLTFFNALNDGVDQTFGTFVFTSDVSIELSPAFYWAENRSINFGEALEVWLYARII